MVLKKIKNLRFSYVTCKFIQLLISSVSVSRRVVQPRVTNPKSGVYILVCYVCERLLFPSLGWMFIYLGYISPVVFDVLSNSSSPRKKQPDSPVHMTKL